MCSRERWWCSHNCFVVLLTQNTMCQENGHVTKVHDGVSLALVISNSNMNWCNVSMSNKVNYLISSSGMSVCLIKTFFYFPISRLKNPHYIFFFNVSLKYTFLNGKYRVLRFWSVRHQWRVNRVTQKCWLIIVSQWPFYLLICETFYSINIT